VTRQSRGTGAALCGVALVIGIIITDPIWVLFSTIALLVLGLAEAWWRWGATGIEYRRILSSRTLSCGDTLECVIEVTNRKLLPMPWLDTSDDWPAALMPATARHQTSRANWWQRSRDIPMDGGPEVSTGLPIEGTVRIPHVTDREILQQRLTLAPFERVRRRFLIACGRRGAYGFGPVAFRWRDAFGLSARDADLDVRDDLVVYPRVVPVIAPAPLARQVLGDRVRRQSLFADPSRLAGVREYIPGDSLRRVHWGASARSGTLQVRRDEPTGGRRLWVIVDVETAPEDRWWAAGDTDAQETVVMVAASLATWAMNAGVAVGISANGRSAGSSGDMSIPCGTHPRHQTRILDGLARLRPWPSRLLREAMVLASPLWPTDASVILVTCMPSEAKREALARACRRGQSAFVVNCAVGVPKPNSRREMLESEPEQGPITPPAAQFSSIRSVRAWNLDQPEVSWDLRDSVRIS